MQAEQDSEDQIFATRYFQAETSTPSFVLVHVAGTASFTGCISSSTCVYSGCYTQNTRVYHIRVLGCVAHITYSIHNPLCRHQVDLSPNTAGGAEAAAAAHSHTRPAHTTRSQNAAQIIFYVTAPTLPLACEKQQKLHKLREKKQKFYFSTEKTFFHGRVVRAKKGERGNGPQRGDFGALHTRTKCSVSCWCGAAAAAAPAVLSAGASCDIYHNQPSLSPSLCPAGPRLASGTAAYIARLFLASPRDRSSAGSLSGNTPTAPHGCLLSHSPPVPRTKASKLLRGEEAQSEQKSFVAVNFDSDINTGGVYRA